MKETSIWYLIKTVSCVHFGSTLCSPSSKMGTQLPSELRKVKVVGKRSGFPTSVTPLPVQVGSLTTTSPYGSATETSFTFFVTCALAELMTPWVFAKLWREKMSSVWLCT